MARFPFYSLPINETFRMHAADTLRLAVPVMFARAGLLLLTLVDTVMVGHLGAEELAWLSLGLGPQLVLMLVGIGMLQGGIVLTAQAFGAGETRTCGTVWRVNLVHALGLGLFVGALSTLGGPFSRLLGISDDLAAGAGAVAIQFAWGMPGMLLYIACGYLLEGIRQPRVGMAITLGANLVNIALNWVLIYGAGPVPALGAVGAVAATSTVRWLVFGVILCYVLFVLDREEFGIHLDFSELASDEARALGRRIRRLGIPMGIVQAVESSAMAGLIFLAGAMGALAAASHQVAINVVQFFYMVAIGMGAAASVRVGFHVGAGDLHGVRLSGWTAVALLAMFSVPVGIFVATHTLAIASIFTSDPPVLAIAKVSLVIGGMLIFFHGTMNVLIGSLRGAGDVWAPLAIQGIAFWLVAIPLARFFSGPGGPALLKVEEMGRNAGAPGLIFGLFVGVILACLLLSARFWYVASRPIARR